MTTDDFNKWQFKATLAKLYFDIMKISVGWNVISFQENTVFIAIRPKQYIDAAYGMFLRCNEILFQNKKKAASQNETHDEIKR